MSNWKHTKKKSMIDSAKVASTYGYVYFLQEQLHNTIKIGYTSSITNRLVAFSVKLPFELKLIHVIYSENAKETEKLFHNYFADKRLNGEWFRINEDDIRLVKVGIYPESIRKSIAGKYYMKTENQNIIKAESHKSSVHIHKNNRISINRIDVPNNLLSQALNPIKNQKVLEYMKANNVPKKNVTVKKHNNSYTLISGYREYMIAKQLGWNDIPVIYG